MCHEYGTMWWRSETKTTVKRTKDAEAAAPRTPAAQLDKEPKPATERKVEEKELIPAE